MDSVWNWIFQIIDKVKDKSSAFTCVLLIAFDVANTTARSAACRTARVPLTGQPIRRGLIIFSLIQ